MIKKYTNYYILSFIIEGLIGAGALWIAVLLGNFFYLHILHPTGGPISILIPGWLFFFVILGLPLLLYLNRAHTFPNRLLLGEITRPAAKAILQLVLIVIAFSFVIKSREITRILIIFFGLICYGLILLKHSGFRLLLARSQPYWQILLIGDSSGVRNYISDLKKKSPCGINIFGLLTDEAEVAPGSVLDGIKVIGRVKMWEATLLNNQNIDEVIIFPNGKVGLSLNSIIRLGQELQVRVRMAVEEPHFKYSPTLERVGRANLISFQPNPDSFLSLLLKRAFDRVGAALLIILSSPLLLLIAFLIKISSAGPAIFTQKRMGFRGVTFKMFKFRTMTAGAEDQRNQLQEINEMNGPVFKVRNDPRVTMIGKFLRRSSLDELPQLFNILRGEMSLVGPRPLPLTEAEKCDRWEKRRFSMLPGITCLWQINGRNLLDFPQWMKLDLQYINNWSFLLDLKILWKTIGVVLSGRGAY